MGSFSEEVIDEIAECERKKVYLESLEFQLKHKNKQEKINKLHNEIKDLEKEIKKCENNLKDKIGDSFLRDNLLYFKKNNAKGTYNE